MGFKVSVIVPIYNGEKYIENVCKQLQSQTLNDIEVILVDDGSKDNSRKIADECSRKYNNVISIHQENKGVSVARNQGISIATGEYLGFVDVDDSIDADMYESLYYAAKNNNLDVVCMEDMWSTEKLSIIIDKKEILSNFCLFKIGMSACNKLFKKSLYPRFSFPEGKRINEDAMAVYRALSSAERIGCINIDKYHYNRHEGSSSRSTVFTEKYFDAIEIADVMYNEIIEMYPSLLDMAEARRARTYLRISKIYYMRGAPKEYKNRIKELKRYLKELPKNKLTFFFSKFDLIRYVLYSYAKPLFLILIKTIDKK